MKKQRIRIQFSKTKAMRYTGHLDLRKTWERIFRRSGLPLAYSQGYTPHPLLNMASPLPLGFTSTAEIGDFWLSESCSLETIEAGLEAAVPPGIKILEVQEIEDIHGDKLPMLIYASEYTVTLPTSTSSLQPEIARLQEADIVTRERRGKSYNLRELIHNLEMLEPTPDGKTRLRMTLSNLPGATGRPDEVVSQLGFSPFQTKINRSRIYLNQPDA